ncbi:MAG: tripartite tricarboxylate transporter TctB family protein [Pseudomonadota bacterium]
MASDRIFGLVALLVALGYGLSATQIQTSFLSDPVGPKAFPLLIAGVAGLCALVMVLRPDGDPAWPGLRTWGALAVAVVVLIAYAYALRPLGFLIPTALATACLSYQISGRIGPAVLAGLGLSIGLFLLFRYALGLGLVAFPEALSG